MERPKFRPERFVLSSEMAQTLQDTVMRLDAFEVDEDGSARLVFVPDEVDFSGCSAVGVGGYHSESYGDEGGECQWCGEKRENR